MSGVDCFACISFNNVPKSIAHSTEFAGIRLKGLIEGNWAELSAAEMDILNASMLPHS